MKILFSLYLLIFSIAAGAAEPPPFTNITGTVVEFQDVDAYTYVRLKTKDGEIWAAVSRTPLKNGAEVTVENAMVMTNFESKTLKKTFATIYFGNLSGAGGSAQVNSAEMAAAHGNVGKAPDTADIHVAKASGANARTVAEIVTQSGKLKDKPVLVRGKVVKYNPAIMGKNWVHLRDGSGSAADNTNDILVTTANAAKLGEVVTVNGVVRTEKDFGAGYLYKVLIEDAALQR